MKTKKIQEVFLIFFYLFVIGLTTSYNSYSQQENALILKDNWSIQSSKVINTDGKEISTIGFSPDGWYSTTVPTTVLYALVKHNVYPNPYYGTNLMKIPGFRYGNWGILDMPKDSPFRVAWWYRTVFELPVNYKGKNLWLNLRGINYKANVWLNGHLIADTTTIEGPYRLYDLDITRSAIAGKRNCLALEIIPPVKGTDLSIRWMEGTRTPPDKDTGIWYDVKVIATGPLRILHPHIITDLDLPDTSIAHIKIATEIINKSAKPVSGLLQGEIIPVNNIGEGGNSPGGSKIIRFSKKISLLPKAAKVENYALDISNPALWWPHFYGKQNLYDLKLSVQTKDGKISDVKTMRFGIRKISSFLYTFGPNIHTRVFRINGRKIMVKGANYTENMMMEHSRAVQEAEAKYMVNMNFNAIRTEGFWGTNYFYKLCDKYGIMIFDGTNCCSIWERWDHWTSHTAEIAVKSLRDQIIRKRNHPCFVDWLIGSDKSPPVNVEKMYVDIINKYDGTRPYQSNANTDSTAICGNTGLSHDPYPDTYDYLPPSTWYGKGKFGKYEFLEFNTEVGPGGEQVPPIESMRRMMPKQDLWPISKSWDLRLWKVQSHLAKTAFYSRYGRPASVEDYTVKAQVFQKEAMRAMVEAYRKNKYKSSGILIYRLNDGWPSLCYQLFDYYLRPDGAFYGVQQAFEPLHVQYSYDDGSIFVVNGLYEAFKNLKVTARIYDFGMKEKYSNTSTISIGPDANKPVFTVPLIKGLTSVYFLRLALRNDSGKLISSNFYWLSSKGDQKADFRDLMKLPPVSLDVSATLKTEGNNSIGHISIKNPTSNLAFFINPTVIKGPNGSQVLPAFWSSNYISLLPGEKRDLTVKFNTAKLNGHQPYLMIEGWNIKPKEIFLQSPNKDVTPEFKYVDLKLPERVQIGQEFNVSVIVKNSAISGNVLLKAPQFLYIDQQPTTYRRVALGPGEVKKLIWHSIRIKNSGEHEIRVGNSLSERILVTR